MWELRLLLHHPIQTTCHWVELDEPNLLIPLLLGSFSLERIESKSCGWKLTRMWLTLTVTLTLTLTSTFCTSKCSITFRWIVQLLHFSHDKMYQDPCHWNTLTTLKYYLWLSLWEPVHFTCSVVWPGVGRHFSRVDRTGGREGGTAATYSVCRPITVNGDSRLATTLKDSVRCY